MPHGYRQARSAQGYSVGCPACVIVFMVKQAIIADAAERGLIKLFVECGIIVGTN